MLSAKVLMEQGIEVTGVSFTSNFFNANRAKKAAKQLGIKLKIINISDELLALVKNPPSGYGKNLNPCIDCHALMIRKANELTSPQPSASKGEGAKEFDFVATGEVLGQRPFSQNRVALNRVMKLAGREVLRPLSAKLFKETEMEKNGLVDREKLLSLSGRTRQEQMELAKVYGIKEYPSPAGGCLLTDPVFGQRIGEMIKKWPTCEPDDVELLKYGRVHWLLLQTEIKIIPVLIIISRNEAESKILTRLAKNGNFIVKLSQIPGPIALLRILDFRFWIKIRFNKKIKISIPEFIEKKIIKNTIYAYNSIKELLDNACLLTGYCSTKARGKVVEFEIKNRS